MTTLLNATSGRFLREMDHVRLTEGTYSGKLGRIIGFDLLNEDCPVVVQVPKPQVILQVGTNEVELFQESDLEPLPPVKSILSEGAVAPVFQTCGVMLCLTLNEDGTVLTFVPKSNGRRLRTIFEANYKKGLVEAIKKVMESSFVTRTPHLVRVGRSAIISKMLEKTSGKESLTTRSLS
jgi:hypothetical protein